MEPVGVMERQDTASSEGPAKGSPVHIPPIISVDDHVVEPPHLWQRWLPARYRDAGPKVVRAPYELTASQQTVMAASGPETDFWVYENSKVAIHNAAAAAGLAPEEIDFSPRAYDEMRPAFFDPKARLADMDLNHIERSVCFPSTFPRFAGQAFFEAKDKDLAMACLAAYNDWMVEEWAGDSGGRLIPLCLTPLWDPHLAAAEVRRNAARGVHAATFCELPAALGLPSLYTDHWDPLLAACNETATTLCLHIGSATKHGASSPDSPRVSRQAALCVGSQLALIDWLMSANLVKFPKLKVAFSEGQIGWIPYICERLDRLFHKGRAGAQINPLITEVPSSYVKDHLYGCFFEDDFGVASRDFIGIDQITFETDYPHQDTTWPDTKAYAEHVLAGLTAEEIDKVIRRNAIKLFSLPETLG
jgi:predicted TIM-barrel fold metal-dependent hydrolase